MRPSVQYRGQNDTHLKHLDFLDCYRIIRKIRSRNFLLDENTRVDTFQRIWKTDLEKSLDKSQINQILFFQSENYYISLEVQS